MSIIYDALQKTQATREKIANVHEKPRRKSLSTRLLASTLLILLIGITTYAVFKLYPHKVPTKPILVVVPKLPNPSAFNLNGLFLSDEEKMAIINNKIVHVGDILDNMKVVSILDEGVTLQNDSGRILLKEDILRNGL